MKNTSTKASSVEKTKMLTTKHGNGDLMSIEDVQAARYRKHVLDQEYTKKDIVLTVLATLVVVLVAHTFTNAWYGF